MARTFQERYLKKKRQQRPQPQPQPQQQKQKQRKRPPQRGETKPTATGPSDSLFGGEPTNKPSRSELDWEAFKTTAKAVPKAISVPEPTTKPLVPGDYGYGHKNPRSSSQRGDVLLSKDAYPKIPTGFPPGKINTLPQEKPVGSSPPTLPTTSTPITSAVGPTSGTPTATTPSKEPTSFFEDLPPATPMSVPLGQPSSVSADDWSRMTGNFKDVTTGEIVKGPALAEVVGGKSKSYDPGASTQTRQERAQQFLKDYPAVDVTGKSSAQVQSEMADASGKYLKNIEEGVERPTRDVSVKRPLSERAPEYRDTKQGREYWEAFDITKATIVVEDEGGNTRMVKPTTENLRERGFKFDPQQGGWGKWERDPRKDLDYPEARIRDLSDKRTPEVKTAQRNVAREIREGLSQGVDYWDRIENRSKYEELIAKAATEGNISPLLFRSFMKREKDRINIPRESAEGRAWIDRLVRNPANKAMRGQMDPQAMREAREQAFGKGKKGVRAEREATKPPKKKEKTPKKTPKKTPEKTPE